MVGIEHTGLGIAGAGGIEAVVVVAAVTVPKRSNDRQTLRPWPARTNPEVDHLHGWGRNTCDSSSRSRVAGIHPGPAE